MVAAFHNLSLISCANLPRFRVGGPAGNMPQNERYSADAPLALLSLPTFWRNAASPCVDVPHGVLLIHLNFNKRMHSISYAVGGRTGDDHFP